MVAHPPSGTSRSVRARLDDGRIDAGQVAPGQVASGRIDTPSSTRERSSSSSIINESRALAADLKDWVDLKLRHTQLQVRQQVDTMVRQAIVRAVVATLAGVAGLFILLALALGFGRWTGYPSAGFAIVAAVLLMGAGAVWLVRKRFEQHEQKARVPLDSVEHPALPRATSEPTPEPAPVSYTAMMHRGLDGAHHAR